MAGTLTNIVAFLPLLLVGGGGGEFIYSPPIVVTASLGASRIVSMTFISMLGYYMLKGQHGLEAGVGEGVKRLMLEIPGTENIHDDWDPQSLQINLQVATDRANMTGVTNQDVAVMTNAALSGYTATTIRERDRQVPVVLRLRPDERSRIDDMKTLQVSSLRSGGVIPLDQLAAFKTEMVSPKIARRDNERCLTVKCDTVPGVLPSGVAQTLEKKLAEVSKAWPPGYHATFGGEVEDFKLIKWAEPGTHAEEGPPAESPRRWFPDRPATGSPRDGSPSRRRG